MLGNTCSAKLQVPADLPFTERGAQPLLCTAHGTEQEPAVFPSHRCVPADKKSSRAFRLYILQLLTPPKSFGLCRCPLPRLTVLATETQGCVHLYSFKTIGVNPLYFNIFLSMLMIPFKNFFKMRKMVLFDMLVNLFHVWLSRRQWIIKLASAFNMLFWLK